MRAFTRVEHSSRYVWWSDIRRLPSPASLNTVSVFFKALPANGGLLVYLFAVLLASYEVLTSFALVLRSAYRHCKMDKE